MTKKTIINLAGIEGFDDNGQPIEEEVTVTDEVSGDVETKPEGETESTPVVEEDVRIVADQPVVDEEKLPEDEAKVNEEITRETIAIEELEEEVTNVDQQQQNVAEVSDQVEDTINDIRPTVESGVAIGEEAINMILSQRRRIKARNGVILGGETFETRFGVEGFGLTKSVRLTNSQALLNVHCTEAINIGKKLKAVSVAAVKAIIDLLNAIVNKIDWQGQRSKKLKARLSKLEGYKENIEFESSRIANALVKNKTGESYNAKEFAQLVATKSDELGGVSEGIKKVLSGSLDVAERLKTEAKKPESVEAGMTGAVDSIKQFFKTSWAKIKAPKLASGQLFVGLKLEGESLEGVTKESVEAKSATLKTPSASDLGAILDLVAKASENVKKGRSSFGAIYKAKEDLGGIADSLISLSDKIEGSAGKDQIRQACNQMVREGRDQLQALKDLTMACSTGVAVLNDYVDLCISKGSKKPKEEKKEA